MIRGSSLYFTISTYFISIEGEVPDDKCLIVSDVEKTPCIVGLSRQGPHKATPRRWVACDQVPTTTRAHLKREKEAIYYAVLSFLSE